MLARRAPTKDTLALAARWAEAYMNLAADAPLGGQMTTTPTTLVRRGPKRPSAPNSKGLGDTVTLPVKLSRPRLKDLRRRAQYETLRWRLEHGGKGRVISAQDIVRRQIDNLFRTAPAVPDDAIGRMVK